MKVHITANPMKIAIVIMAAMLLFAVIDVTLSKIKYDHDHTLSYAEWYGLSPFYPYDPALRQSLVKDGILPKDTVINIKSKTFDDFRYRFDFDQERNIPTWMSSANLILAGLAAMAVGFRVKALGRPRVLAWLFLAAFLIYFSMDDTAVLHEMLGGHKGSLGSRLNDFFGLSSFIHYDWVIPAMVVGIPVLLMYLPFWWSLPLDTRILFVIAFVAFAGSQVGLETVIGDFVKSHGTDNMTNHVESDVEEWFKVFGWVTFTYASIRYMQKYLPDPWAGAARSDGASGPAGPEASEAPTAASSPA